MLNQIDLFLLFVIFIKAYTQNIINRNYIESPFLYKNEICSYNGVPIVNTTSEKEQIKCECYSSYVDEPRESHKKYIGNYLVHCSYKRRKRFTTFFLACLIPMGFDFYYLGHYFYFAIIFSSCILIIITKIICFILSYNLKEMDEESKYQYNNKSDINFNRNNLRFNSKKKKDKKEQLKKCLTIFSIISNSLIAIIIIYWIIDIVSHARGLIRDINKVETENDMNSLFSKEET